MSPELLLTLLTPVAAALALFAAVVVTDARTVYVKTIDVPLQLSESGFNSEVIQEKIANALLDIEREARTREETRELALETSDDTIDLIADYFELEPAVRAFQQSSGIVSYVVDAHVTSVGENYVLEMQIDGRDGSELVASVTHPQADMPGFIRKSAEVIMRVVEPEALCASHLAQALSGAGNVTRAASCIEETLPSASIDHRKWLLNLSGVVKYVQGDQAGAMDRFRAALQLDQHFSPSLVNVGVLLNESGKPAEALKAYDFLFADLDAGLSDRTYAAAYAEWGRTFAKLGQRADAIRVLREGITGNPNYAQTYLLLADLLPAGPEAQTLRERGEYVARTRNQLYTESLVGPVFDAGKAAPPL
jgi:tetratricopeptide (TPR) repeat protein